MDSPVLNEGLTNSTPNTVWKNKDYWRAYGAVLSN